MLALVPGNQRVNDQYQLSSLLSSGVMPNSNTTDAVTITESQQSTAAVLITGFIQYQYFTGYKHILETKQRSSDLP